jgi:DNA mismatch endonuclease (patch repair protein)
MRAVSRRNTAAEKGLQAALRQKSLRFKTHVRILGCCPDIVFQSSRVAVFVDGDFWHGRLLVEGGANALKKSFRKKSQAFWVAKITRNAIRDRHQTNRLRRHGWCVIRFWEREILSDAGAEAALIAKRVSDRGRRTHRPNDV